MNNLTVPVWCKEQQLFLSSQIEAGTLAHAYLISAGKDTGKLALAYWLVSVFSCQNRYKNEDEILSACNQCKPCLLRKAKTYPDDKLIDQPNENISVDAIRQISSFLEKTPQIGSGQTVVINYADKMTIAAANALLKTLEEPTASTLLLLLTDNIDHLMPTIISRCQLLPLRTLTGDALSSYTQSKTSNSFVNMTYLPELQSDELHRDYLALSRAFFQFLNNPNDRVHFLALLVGHERAIIWLERAVTTAIRDRKQLILDGIVSHDELLRLEQALNSDTLLSIFQLILQLKRKSTTLVQANDGTLKEKLVIEIAQSIDKLEA